MLGDRQRKWILRVATVALTFVAVAVQEWRLHRALHDAHATGDLAVFETNVRMALEGVQRFGPYSQGFRHPGPAYFYFLAVPYSLGGQTTFSLYAGAQALTLLFIVGSAVALSRFSASVASALAFIPLVLLELEYLGDFPLFDFWPPYVLIFGYAALLVLAAGLGAGRTVMLGPFVALGSFLVQTHIGYALPVLGAAVVAVAFLLGSGEERPRLRRDVTIAGVILAVLWVLPLHADLFEGSGNLRRIFATFVERPSMAWRPRELFDRVALELTGPLQFALFGDRFIVPEAPKHFLVARLLSVAELWALFFAWRAAQRRGDRFAEVLCMTCFTAVPVAALALLGIRGTVAPHHTAWISAIGLVMGVALIASVAGPLLDRKPTWSLGARRLLLASVFCAISIGRPISVIAGIHRVPEVAVLATAVSRVAQASREKALRLDWPGRQRGASSPASELAVGLLLELEKRGTPCFTKRAPGLDWALGRKRWAEHDDGAAALLVTAGNKPAPGTALACIDQGDDYFLRYPLCLFRED